MWRDYLPHALMLGATLGAVLWLILWPMRKRREQKRTQALVDTARKNIHGHSRLTEKKRPYESRRKWRVEPPKDSGYYNAR